MPDNSYKHIDGKQREMIEEGLNAKMGISAIAKSIGVSASTVSREIVRNRRDDSYRANSMKAYSNGNLCDKRRGCDKLGLCRRCVDEKARACSLCKRKRCSDMCGEYAEEICAQIASSPHVCNGCGSSSTCRLHRFRYSAKDAQHMHETRGREAREGIDCTPEEVEAAQRIIKAGLEKKQGINHIFLAHAGEMPFSKSSCYRHIRNGDIAIMPIELPKAVKYKPRNHPPNEKPLDPKAMEGHLYSDFLALSEAERARVVECDCMEGPSGSVDAILTIHFKALHFQIGIKLARKDTEHVVAAFDWIHGIIGDLFSDIFGIILCDRGSEFKDIEGMELHCGVRRCKVYFTDSRHPEQKGACEKNHVEARCVVPKGTSLALIDQAVLADVFSNVNSKLREALFGLSPMELALKALPKALLDELGYRLIDPDEVLLTPAVVELAKAGVGT